MGDESSEYDDKTKEHPIIWLHNNTEEVNVNHVSEYSMISPHSNNKEVMKRKYDTL